MTDEELQVNTSAWDANASQLQSDPVRDNLSPFAGEEEEEKEKDQGFFPDNPIELAKETGTALIGGAADAVESVGGFAELTGDTFKTAVNNLMGRPTLESQNPFSENYVSNDAGWLDIPDHLVPENQSGLGKLARGITEFGLLVYATGGIGGYTAGAAKVGTRLAATARAAGVGSKGVRTIKFLHKGAVIGAEGATADLISNSSESANIANLVNEHTPWIPFSEALAIDPERDNAWVARIKTVTAGAGINIVGHALAGFVKGSWAAAKARKAGATVDEANTLGNQVMDAEIKTGSQLDEAAATEMAVDRWSQGRGISHAIPRDEYVRKYLNEEETARYFDPATSPADRTRLEAIADQLGEADGNPWDDLNNASFKQLELNLHREPDPFVNPRKFDDSDRATYRPDSPDPVRSNIAESISDMRRGGDGASPSPLVTEAALKRMSGNNIELQRYIVKVAQTLSKEAFKDIDNVLGFKEVQQLIIKQADELYGLISPGGEQAVKDLQNYFKKGEDGIEYRHAGGQVVTGTASQKMALQLVIKSLTRQASTIAQSARGLHANAPLLRQLDQTHDLLKIALTEHKKIGFMTGLELRYQKGDVLPQAMRNQVEKGLKQIDDDQNAFFAELDKLAKNGDWQLRRDLSELYELSGGKVRTVEDIHTYLKAMIRGGRMNGTRIPSRIRTELRSVFYNSILSSLKTPIKAIAGTNLIGVLRPFQAYLGAGLTGNKTELLLAGAQIDALGKAWAEGFDMFKHNWDLGVNRQSQAYAGRFDFDKQMDEWKSLKPYYETYGTGQEVSAYNMLDSVVDLNNNPWMKYSQNAMGAGDALARTVIGRFEMRMRAARAAIESGVDLDNVKAWAEKNEELFRKEIFKQDEHGKWIVSDRAAKLAGDEAAMTKALEGNLEGLERISRITGLRAFFPFVRTGFNALNLAWQHTDGARFTAKWHDIMNGENLAKYGIRPQDLGQAQAVMRGRLAMGRGVIGMSVVAALAGNMTGDYPMDKETRDLWRINGIQPNSFKFGDVYISYKDIEPFNTIFAATANVISFQHVLGEDMRDEWLEKLTWMTTAVIVDKSMLAGVEDLAQVMSADTGGGKLSRTAAKFTRAHLPYAGLLAQLGGIMNSNEVEANTLWETIWKRDAIAKGFLHPKYDILSKDRKHKPYVVPPGNPLMNLFNALSPVAVTFADNDPVKMALKEMSFNLPEVLSTYKGVALTSYEKSQVQKYMQMSNLRKELEQVMKNRRWRESLDRYKAMGLRSADGYKLTDQYFYQSVHHVFRKYKNIAMAKLVNANPVLGHEIDERAVKRQLGKNSKYDQIEQLLSMPK